MDVLDRLVAAGCDVRLRARRDWMTTGNFTVDPPRTPKRPEHEEGRLVPAGKLEEAEFRVLKAVAAWAGEKEPTAEDIASLLKVSIISAAQHLDNLVESQFLYDLVSTGAPQRYGIDKKGLAYLVKWGLVYVIQGHAFRTPNGREWTATVVAGWIEFEEIGTRRLAAGPCEPLFDPSDEELNERLLTMW